jgi:hypothetical protein
MGFLDKLRGGSDNAITLDVRPAEVAPGGEVAVRFEVLGQLDAKARGIRLTLEGTGSYKVNVTRTYGPSDDSNVSTVEEWQSYSLHKEEHELPAQTGPGEATFKLPPDALPSSAGVVSWTVSARIDRAGGMDKVVRQDISVRHGGEGLPGQRAPQQHEDGLTLDDVPVAVRAGSPLTGHLTVAVDKDVKVTAARIRLYRKVTYTAAAQTDGTIFGAGPDGLSAVAFIGSNHIKDETKVAEVDLAGKREFAAGSVERLPFTIDVPTGAGPTTAHSYGRVEWRLEAVLDRRMRGDLAVDTPLVVF